MKAAQQFETADFKLNFAPADFEWSGRLVPKLPLLRWPDGLLCEPVLYYFGASALNDRVAISSMKPEAYIIREWLVSLSNKGLSLYDANDKRLETYRRELGWPEEKTGKEKDKVPPRVLRKKMLIQRKLQCLFEFYRLLPKVMPFQDGGVPTPVFVGKEEEDSLQPLTFKMAWSRKKKRQYHRWSGLQRLQAPPTVPVVANDNEVVRLYGYLRQHAFRAQRKLKLLVPREKDSILADRNWLIAGVLARGGLRCDEASDLTVDQLALALYTAGITNELLDLDAVVDEETQNRIYARVLSLKKGEEYAFLSVEIVGKGGKTRHVPFPPSLIVDLLKDGVWGCRRRQIMLWQSRDPGFIPPPAIFLSQQTRGRLDEGSIGDLIGKAFRTCRIKKGAHKLRGHFATKTAAAIWKSYFAANNYRFDQMLINRALDQLARAMGHAQIDTTVKYYLDVHLLAHLTKIGTPEAQLFRRLWDILVMERQQLSERVSKLLLKLAERIAIEDEKALIFDIIDQALDDPRLLPKKSPKPLAVV